MSWLLDENQLLRYSDLNIWQGRYIQADYIEFDWGNNGGWIDTGLPSYTNSIWYADFEYITAANENWIAGGANLSNNVACICGTANGTNWYTDTGVSYDKAFGTGVRIRGKFNANGLHYTAPNNIYLGCRNWGQSGQSNPDNNSSAHFKVYGFYMSRSGVVQRDMRPAYDNIAEEWGMYDTVSNTFFGNAGATGTSIAGGYISPSTTLTPSELPYDYEHRNMSDWYMNSDDIVSNDIIPTPIGWQAPYPFSVWYFDEELDHVFNSMIPLPLVAPVPQTGAFMDCSNLHYVRIPRSVAEIGSSAFAGTSLTKVCISRHCRYSPGSFPNGCIIIFYEDMYDVDYDEFVASVNAFRSTKIHPYDESSDIQPEIP